MIHALSARLAGWLAGWLAGHRPSVPALLLALASLFPIWCALRVSRHLGDDMYITLTFARSLAAGEGFSFHGQTVLATTTPLLALIVAGVSRAAPDVALEDVVVWLSALGWLGVVWTLFLGRRAWRLGAWPAAFLGLVVVATGWVHLLGMEGYLFAFLFVLAITLTWLDRPMAAGVVSGLLALTRGEGLLLPPLLVVADLARRAAEVAEVEGGAVVGASTSPAVRRPWLKATGRLALGWSGVIVPWVLYALPAFGTPWPSTLAAKASQGQSGLWRPFVPDLFARWMPQWSAVWGPEHPAILNPVWWLVLLGVAAALWRDRRWLLPMAWAAGYVVGYGLVGAPSYHWYSLPVTFSAALLAGLGVLSLPRLVTGAGARPGWWRLAAAGIVGVWLLAAAWVPRVGVVRADDGDVRAASYLALASWLREHTEPAESVAFVEVGYLGYFTGNPIVDLAGLTTPGVAPHVRRGDFATGFWRHEPDYFLFLPDFEWALGGIVTDPRFGRAYQAVAAVPGPGETDFTIYGRRTSGDSMGGTEQP